MKKNHFFSISGSLIFGIISVSPWFSACKSKQQSTSAVTSPSTPSQNKGYSPVIQDDEALVLISTEFGDIKVRLYNSTPIHRDNFLKLVEEKYYDSLLFHRVIKDFMIQGGDPDSKNAAPKISLGEGGPNYTLTAEFRPEIFHRKGALCAARQPYIINPLKESSASQFYLVQGRKMNESDLLNYEKRINTHVINKIGASIMGRPGNEYIKERFDRYKKNKQNDSLQILQRHLDSLVMVDYKITPHYEFSAEQKKIYKSIGGTPHLDGSYTVFGEIYEGLVVLDKLAELATDERNRPLKDSRMKMKVIRKPKLRKE